MATSSSAVGCERLIEALLTVPDETRRFACDAATAARVYGIDEQLLETLIGSGLPFRDDGDERTYSNGDLRFLGLRLGTAVFQRRAFEAWTARLLAAPGVDRTRLRIRYVPRLSDGRVSCRGSILLPDGRKATTLCDQRPAADVMVYPRWEWPAIDARVAALLEEVAATTDTYLFDARAAVPSAYEGPLMDCSLAAELVYARCRELGYDCRMSNGIIASPMVSVPHVWVDLRIEDDWVPADSTILGLLRRLGYLSCEDWPATGSFGGLLVRLSDRWEPIMLEDHVSELRMVDYSLYTTAG